MATALDTRALLERLIAFATVSRDSNLALIDFVADYLDGLGVAVERIYSEDGRKANLFATIGPADRPGIVLSGHSDVVPVEGQAWSSDPFRLWEQDDKLFGRGSADMKGFLAVCLAMVPSMLARPLREPLQLCFSYDEEIGCLGIRRLLAWLAEQPVKPRACLIGEPTGMEVIRGHKGKLSLACQVHGLESHSGLAHRGVNAVEAAAEAIAYLKAMARQRRDHGPFDPAFDPPYTTIHTGCIHGGTALNIVPQHCEFEFEFRAIPADDPDQLLQQLHQFVAEQLLPEMQALHATADFHWREISRYAALDVAADAEVVRLALHLAERNGAGKVSFGTEGGLFQECGIPAVICGPGYITQAHKPDEYVALSQLARCETFIGRLIDELAA